MVLMQTLLTFTPSPTPIVSHPIRQLFLGSSLSLSHHSLDCSPARPFLASVARPRLSICRPCFVAYFGADK